MYIEDFLIKNILKLGTKAEWYLQNFYNYFEESKNSYNEESKKFSKFKDFLNKNELGIAKRTIEQNKHVFEIFNILKDKENFNEDFLSLKSFNDFRNLLLKNIQIKINDYYNYLDDKYFLSILIELLIKKEILSKNSYNKKILDYLKYFDLSNSKKGYNSLFRNLKINFTEKDFIEKIQKFYKICFDKIEKIENKFIKEEKYFEEENISKSKDREISIINFKNFLKNKISEQNSFIIPFYQRRYVWEENNIKMLFSSILEKDIFLNLNNIHINTEFSKNNLVDGQQRLTSLIIILQNLLNDEENVNFLIKNNHINEWDLKLIQNNIKYYFGLLEKHLFIDSKEINAILNNSNLPKRSNNKKSLLYTNFEFIQKFLKNYSKKEENNILYKILGVEFILVYEINKNDVLKFVELNSNSKSLTNYELSKSYLISFSKKNNPKYEIEKKIKDFEEYFFPSEKLNEKKIDIFLSSYLKIKKLENINDLNYFLPFKKYIEEKNNIENLIKDLKQYLNYFLIVNDNNFNLIKENENKKKFKFLEDILFTFRNQKIYLPILMYFLNLIDSKDYSNFKNTDIRFFLLKLEVFHFKWKIVNFRGNSLPKIMLNLLININQKIDDTSNLNYCFEQQNVKFIKEVLSISNSDFISELNNFKFKDNNLPLKIILRIEKYNGKITFEKKDQDNLITFDYNSLTLEHIYPQNSKNKIDKMEEKKNNLLNLIFLTESLNKSVKNDSPIKKYDEYIKHDVFKYNKSLSCFEKEKSKFKNEFIFDTLEKRQEKLVNIYKDFLNQISPD